MISPRLLILDDEVVVASLLAVAAQARGWLVTVTADPREALALTRENAADVFLVDYQMPRENGVKVIETLRSNGSTVPVIMMSGNPPAMAADQLQRLGIVTILEKPFDLEPFIQTLKQALAPATSCNPSASAAAVSMSTELRGLTGFCFPASPSSDL